MHAQYNVSFLVTEFSSCFKNIKRKGLFAVSESKKCQYGKYRQNLVLKHSQYTTSFTQYVARQYRLLVSLFVHLNFALIVIQVFSTNMLFTILAML